MIGGQQKTSRVGARGLSRYHPDLPTPCDASLIDHSHTHGSTMPACASGSPEAGNGASSGALYYGGHVALPVRCATRGSMPVGKDDAEFSATTALCRRLYTGDSPRTRSQWRVGGNRIALSGEVERAATDVTGTRYFHPSHLAESIFRRSLHPSLLLCRWVAGRHRAVFPQPLLMRANAVFIQLLSQL